jgi:hypothetical protein
VHTQHSGTNGVERPTPHSLQINLDETRDSFAHLTRCLVCECDCKNAGRIDAMMLDQSRDPGGENGRLSRAGAGNYEKWAFEM